MSSTGKTNQSKESNVSHRLSDQAHQQTMEFLHLAEESEHPAIRKIALELAKDNSTYHRKQNARVPPTLILWILVLLGFIVAGAWWYAFLHYPERKAYQLGSVAILVYLAIIGVCLFLSGRLSQANFMKILGWIPSHLKTRWNLFNRSSAKPSDPPD